MNGPVDFGTRIVTTQEFIPFLTEQREQDACLAVTNGGFDLLHVGHIRYFQTERALRDGWVVSTHNSVVG